MVRVYQAEDRSACEALWVELAQRHRDIYDDPGIGGCNPAQGFQTYLVNPNRRMTWVAVVGGQVVGMAGLIVCGDEGDVEPVIVAGTHRSRGIGR